MIAFWKKTVLLSTICLMVFFGLVWFRFLPNLKAIIRNNKETAQKETELKAINDKIAVLKGSESDSEEISNALTTVNELWPDKEEVSNFIVEIEGLTAKKGLILDSLSVIEKPAAKADNGGSGSKSENKESAKSAKDGIGFNFDTSGHYTVIKEFIADLEKLSRFNTVSTVSLTNGSQDMIAIRINGYIYAK